MTINTIMGLILIVGVISIFGVIIQTTYLIYSVNRILRETDEMKDTVHELKWDKPTDQDFKKFKEIIKGSNFLPSFIAIENKTLTMVYNTGEYLITFKVNEEFTKVKGFHIFISGMRWNDIIPSNSDAINYYVKNIKKKVIERMGDDD